MSKIVLVIVAIIIIAGGAYFFAKKNTNSSAQIVDTSATESVDTTVQATDTVPESTQATVTFSDQGFTPASLTVTAGTTVTFTNASNSAVQVGSDPHPTHTGLPGFDSEKGLSNGESYQFTFSKTGTFGYHNHLNPSQTGTIIVK